MTIRHDAREQQRVCVLCMYVSILHMEVAKQQEINQSLKPFYPHAKRHTVLETQEKYNLDIAQSVDG